MRIAFDVSQVVYGTGVSVYTLNLIKNLLEIDKKNHYFLYSFSFRRSNELKNIVSKLSGNFEYKNIYIPPTAATLLFNSLNFPFFDRLYGNSQVIHYSDWVVPKSNACKVTTIHDLVPILFPDQSHPRIINVQRHILSIARRGYFDKIIVPSRQTKIDLMKNGVKSSFIEVVPEAVEEIYSRLNENEVKLIREKYNLPENYFLCVGTSERKNISRMALAHEKIAKETNTKLVVTGHVQSNFRFGKNCIFTGFVDKEDMPAIYQGAIALVYVSLYEGFGLPILEAFRMGTPVITANIGSMKEIAYKNAILVDPQSIYEISNSMKNIMQKSDKFRQLGLEASKKYNWAMVAEKTLRIYESTINDQ